MPSPPWLMLISSTYSISSMAFFFPMYSKRVPPNWFVILYFPSEKAPAPPKPFIMEQGLQPTQLFTFTPSMGHFLFSRGFPDSKTDILRLGFSFTNSYALNIPPGPAPIINTSALSAIKTSDCISLQHYCCKRQYLLYFTTFYGYCLTQF